MADPRMAAFVSTVLIFGLLIAFFGMKGLFESFRDDRMLRIQAIQHFNNVNSEIVGHLSAINASVDRYLSADDRLFDAAAMNEHLERIFYIASRHTDERMKAATLHNVGFYHHQVQKLLAQKQDAGYDQAMLGKGLINAYNKVVSALLIPVHT